MEKGFNSWSQDQETGWQSFNPNLASARFGLGPRVLFPSFGNMVSPPLCREPRYRQGFVPMVNSIVKEVEEKLSEASPNVTQETSGVQKKFLVFDQSGDQTTLMYSLGVTPTLTHHQFPSFNIPKPQFGSHVVYVEKPTTKDDGMGSESEMREDTEELNALLYSDDDAGYDDDDDETSTGHSPNSTVGRREQKRKPESDEEEEVASSGGPLKRHKNALEDTASSGKSGINCSANGLFEEEYDGFTSGNKRLRIEKMKEVINLLQNLIPGDTNGKNVIMVIDEAIDYLRNMKVKAKALGLDSS